jgi:predicted MFS family arabinose efflux permease
VVDTQSRSGIWGWRVLLLVAALIALNGFAWLFVGPDSMVSDVAEGIGTEVADFEDNYPLVVEDIVANQRQVAIYLVAIGSMGSLAAFAGSRERQRWPWRITWVLVAVPAALAITGLGAVSGFVIALTLLALFALVGQLLAARSIA